MKKTFFFVLILSSQLSFATKYLTGPAGAPCSGKMLDGTPYSGVQSWHNKNSPKGMDFTGGWVCCTGTTECAKNPVSKPEFSNPGPNINPEPTDNGNFHKPYGKNSNNRAD